MTIKIQNQNYMKQYQDLLRAIQERGTYKPAARANMPGTQSLFGYQFRHNLADGFPLLTTKRMSFKVLTIELLWFLRGDTNIKFLVDNGVNIWNEDAYMYFKKKFPDSTATFEEFIERVKAGYTRKGTDFNYGDCGFQYGKVWRKWEGPADSVSEYTLVDQIANLINSLRNNPESRRHIVTAVDPAHDNDLALYWCHAMMQFNCRPLTEKQRLDLLPPEVCINGNFDYVMEVYGIPKYYLDCQLYQRSADVFLGVPYNIASYALLTELLARICGMIPGEFVHTFGDVHIYDNHREAVEEQLKRTPGSLPKIHVLESHKDHGTLPDHLEKLFTGRYTVDNFLQSLTYHDFRLTGYEPQEAIKAELSTGLIK